MERSISKYRAKPSLKDPDTLTSNHMIHKQAEWINIFLLAILFIGVLRMLVTANIPDLTPLIYNTSFNIQYIMNSKYHKEKNQWMAVFRTVINERQGFVSIAGHHEIGFCRRPSGPGLK